jgi:predicted MPP superfamily phosphohydrolase
MVNAQQPGFKVFLVGDAGEDELTGETLDSLKSKLLQNPNSAVVFLGDNSYRDGFFGLIPGFKGFDSSRITRKKMLSQLSTLDNYKGAAYFVPGNHDWWNMTDYSKGKRKLKMEESFVEYNLSQNKNIANPALTFLPKDGSPGPAAVDINDGKVKLVCIDTYWLTLLGYKENPKQNLDFESIFYTRLDSILASATAKKQTVIVVAHHPIYVDIPAARPLKHPYLFARVKQSYSSFPSYEAMSAKIRAILEKYPGCYYASGHLHALQYHIHNGVKYIISGAGSKLHKVTKEECKQADCSSTDYCLWNEKGFFEIDFYQDHHDVTMYHDNGKKLSKL